MFTFTLRSKISCLLTGLFLATQSTWASEPCQHCGGSGVCQEMVSVCVTEMQQVEETCYRDEVQTKVTMVPKVIQVEKQVPYEYTAWVRVKKEDPQEIEIKTPKFRWVDHKYTEYVPGVDTVTKTRPRTEQVPVTEVCVETVDQGHWETQMVASPTCSGCLCTEKKVWCACPVEVTKEQTVMKSVTIHEPYVCEVCITVPIEKTRKEKEYFTKTETKTVKNPYTTLESRKRTKLVTAFVPETIYEEQLENCTARVPYTVVREVPVEVTRMVPRDIKCECQCE